MFSDNIKLDLPTHLNGTPVHKPVETLTDQINTDANLTKPLLANDRHIHTHTHTNKHKHKHQHTHTHTHTHAHTHTHTKENKKTCICPSAPSPAKGSYPEKHASEGRNSGFQEPYTSLLWYRNMLRVHKHIGLLASSLRFRVYGALRLII